DITLTFSPRTVTPGNSTTLTVSAAANANAGTFPINIKATSNSIVKTTTASLTVTAPGDFSITTTPATKMITPGAMASFLINVVGRNNFTDPVTLSAKTTNDNITLSLSASMVTPGNSATLTAATSANIADGQYNLEINAVSGSMVKTANVTLIVSSVQDF